MQELMSLIQNVERRQVLRAMGAILGTGVAGSMVGVPQASAQQEASGLKRDLPEGWEKESPGIIDATPPFDLDDPLGNWHAVMKITNNHIGAKTYIPMFNRVYLCPDGKAAAPLHTQFGLWTWQLKEPDPEKYPDAKKGALVQHAMYTSVMLDPFTFKPVDTVKNHYTGKTIELKDSLFAETYMFESAGVGGSMDRENFQEDEEVARKPNAYVRWGDDLAIFLAGIFQGEGDYQPRTDSSIWSANYDDIMNPDKDLVQASYNFTGLMRAWERPWVGVGRDDKAQLLWNVQGRKVHSVDDIPEVLRDTVLTKYPGRV